ncbi:hypothetical protein [Shinella sp.]|uniref:hypothetical protein n=1 Tax=Shinella sp. TaxID=1870904 RepID=UPI0029AB7843|nr:hypothetical protein [Shinella sp.]MDX3976577.1 hypothetical protein [Shinella sp.]
MVKPRENRIHMMMSEEELTAIDDWRFANRIATRSDAIRRLCQIGLVLDEKASTLQESSADNTRTTLAMTDRLEDLTFKAHDKGIDILPIMESLADFVPSQAELQYLGMLLGGLAGSFRRQGSVEEAMESAKQVREISLQTLERFKRMKTPD